MKDEIKINKNEIRIRKSWGSISPETKIETPKKNTYKRSDTRSEIQKALEEAEEENEELDFGY